MARYYFSVYRETTTNGTTQTESTHISASTLSQQRIARITMLQAIGRGSSAGGGHAVFKVNTGSAVSGGTPFTPTKRDNTGPAAGLMSATDATAITPGGTLTYRGGVGFAQTGGNNFWTAVEPDDAIHMEPNGANPVDVEIVTKAIGTSIPVTLILEHFE